VHCRGPHFPNIPYFTFIALTLDKAGEILDLGRTLLTVSSPPPAANANLWEFVTDAPGTGALALTRHLISRRMGPIDPSIVSDTMNYNKRRQA
jgi:hypothetical protein